MPKMFRVMIAVALPCCLWPWALSVRASHRSIASNHDILPSTGTVSASRPMRTSRPQLVSSQVVADGATRPDLIPDDVAARHFLAALAISGQPATADLKRLDVMVAALGLSAADRLALEGAARGLKDDIAAAELATGPGTPRSRRIDLLDSVRARLHDRLSSSGYDHFERFVQSRVKSRIKIYRSSAMTADHSHAVH